MNLSPHFTRAELTFSEQALRSGMDNTPNAAALDNLTRLAQTVLEPSRARLGVPLHISSGFRSKLVNAAVGGAMNSAHMEGRAADFKPIGMELTTAFDMLRVSEIPYDKIIIECNAWIHIQIAREGELPRGIMLTASGGPGRWKYQTVTV